MGAVVNEKKDGKEILDLGLGFTISPELLGGTGAEVVAMGTVINSKVVEKYKAVAGRVDRIAVLVDTPVVTKFHYIDDVGYVICFGGACCDADPSPAKVRYLFPIIKYQGDEKGRISKSCGYEVQVLSVGKETYESLVAIHETSIEEEGTGITQFDLKINCTDEQYQKLNFTPTTSSTWRTRPDMIEDIKERWKTITTHMTKAIARTMTPAQFAEAMGEIEEVDEDDDFIEEGKLIDTNDYYEDDEADETK